MRTTAQQIRAITTEVERRIESINGPYQDKKQVVRELALDIHQALADASAGPDSLNQGVITLVGPEDNS